MRAGRGSGAPLVLLAGALAASLAVPAAAQEAPTLPEPTQPVVVVGDDGAEVIDVTSRELAELRADPEGGPVVTRGRTVQAELAQSVPKVGAPSLWTTGERGAGKIIVVIDTGVASSFGGTLVGQACFAANPTGTIGYCGPAGNVTEAFDGLCFFIDLCGTGDVLDPAAGRPCPTPSPSRPEDCAHGTAVAGVAARHNAPVGVAPDAAVYTIRVFNPQGTSADLADVLLALDHVRRLADAGVGIAAVNLSVATQTTFAGYCDSAPGFVEEGAAFRQVFDQLKARGIPAAVASGNDGKAGSMSFPACVSSAVSVGASDFDDELADFGNRGPGLDFLAPGAREGNGTVDPLVIPGSPVSSWAGTSFSTPHVAAAFALIDTLYPKASVDQLTGFLYDSGVPVAEPSTGLAYRRLRLGTPAQTLRGEVLFPTNLVVAGTTRSAIGDVNGDGRTDVLAHGPGSAPDRISYGLNGWSVATQPYSVSGSYLPVVGNFRGTAGGPDDVLWYAAGTASDYLWVGDPSGVFQTVGLSVNGTFAPVVGDFDGNGFDDVLWYAAGTAGDYLWSGGPTGFTSRAVSVAGSYVVVAGDVNGDGFDDLVFHGPNTAGDYLWRGTATPGAWAKSALSMGGSYTIRVGDAEGDGDDDLLLYQPGTRTDSIWRGGPGVGGPGATGGFSPLAISVTGTYQPSMGDLDGDGRDDILWYAPGAPGDYLWFGQPAGPPTSRPITVNGTYTPLLGNLDGDDGDDIVWFQSATTSTPVWWSYAGP